jgi:hypothetical protein
MGSDLKVYNQSGKVYHSKMMIVDPEYPSLDPLVLTGSHNWSVTANTKNDENTLIIHDADIATQYLQSFAANFTALGGSISPATGIDVLSDGSSVSIYPNPTQGSISIDIQNSAAATTIELTDLSGHTLYAQDAISPHNTISTTHLAAGMYLVKVSSPSSSVTYRVIKL